MLRTSQHEFPIIDDAGHVLGILTRENIIGALRRQGAVTTVSEVMQRDLPQVQPDDALDEAFAKMQKSRYPALPVTDSAGRLLGLITAENVGEMVMIKSLQPKEGRPSWRVRHAHGHA